MMRFLSVYYSTRSALLILCEAFLVSSCFLLAAVLVLGSGDAYIALYYEYGLLKIAGITVLSILCSYYFDLYAPQLVTAPQEIYFRMLLVVGVNCFITSAILTLYPGFAIATGPIYVIGFALLVPALLFWRKVYAWIMSRRFFRERVFVLGAGDAARTIVDVIRQRPDIGMEVVEWKEVGESTVERKQIWAATLKQLFAKAPVHRIIIAMEDQRKELPIEEVLALRFKGVKVEEASTLQERLSGKLQLDGLRPSMLLYSDGFRIRQSQQFARQLVFMCIAGFGLLLFLPFFPLVVFAIRFTSKGPIFFRQTRVGVGGKPFQVIKFRSMFTDAESAGARWATKDDPRVTKFGKFMRKTRVDEIPQLWNVLRGDMAFVGPRPERPEFIPMLMENLPYYDLRHLIRPGLTGWAQIRYGYGATLAEAREKLEYDLYYIKHMSPGLDLFIMFETIKIILLRRGAQ